MFLTKNLIFENNDNNEFNQIMNNIFFTLFRLKSQFQAMKNQTTLNSHL